MHCAILHFREVDRYCFQLANWRRRFCVQRSRLVLGRSACRSSKQQIVYRNRLHRKL